MPKLTSGIGTRPREKPPAREAALTLLARRMLSEAQLGERLRRQGYSEAEIEDAATLVRSYGYVDDGALAAAVQREAERTGRGPAWVRRTLLARGVAEDEAAAAERACEAGASLRAARLVEERFGRPTDLDARTRSRAQRFLASSGFSAECALALLGDCERNT